MTAGLGFLLLYIAVVWTLRDQPLARSIVGNSVLVASAALIPIIVLRRRRQWTGCQRLFWDVIAIAMVLWVVGHLGWAYDQLVRSEQAWLKWHTIFSLSAGIGPLVALLARPHLGPRSNAVASTAVTIGAYCLLAAFVYSYFTLMPSLVAEALPGAQSRLLKFVQFNRLAILIGMAASFWFARRTAWRSTYLRLAIGVAIGVILRYSVNQAITRGEYQVGSAYDFAWIVPWLFYAWAALETPPSPTVSPVADEAHEVSPVSLLAVPALLVPLVGYGVLNIQSVGEPVDSFRLFLTSLATVGVLGLVTLRLASQGTELQRADAKLQLLAAATEHTDDLILITRADGTFEHANAAFLRAFGHSRPELATLTFTDLIEHGVDSVRHGIAAIVKAQGVWRGTLRGLRKDGTAFPAACTITALHDASGRVTHFVGVARDITDDLRLRDQLVHSERLSAIGELIAGVAHEINNPLQTIIGCTELMLDDPDASNRTDLELVRKEAMRAGQIVRNLLAFARRGAPDRVVTDLNDLVRATAELRDYHLHQVNIDLVLRCDARPLPVLVNPEEIRQVILNLLLNAEHAVASSGAKRGSITIETLASGGTHSVDVTDSGPGISPELRGRIFEPFFTTREVGEGTGLGLSISHGIASSHGGSLSLADSPGGARFRLSLPAATDESAMRLFAGGAPPRALVVDDDDAIRKLIVRLLERRGFEVSEARTGEAAMALVRERQPGIIICDTAIPSLGGIELYRQLAEQDLQLAPRFLFIADDKASGESADVVESGMPVLVKPFTASDFESGLVEAGVTAPRTH
ncbi:MAG TPA: ATP-binding protein [Vicinamibacterales bacterium]